MQVTVTRKNSYTLSLAVKESGAEFDKARQQVIEKIRQEGRVKGFKKGSNIPEDVIVREFGAAAIEQQALDTLLEKLYPKILKKEAIVPVAPGNITELRGTHPVELTLEVEVFPEITVDTKKLDAIKVKRSKVRVTAAEVDAEIDAIKSRFTHYHEAGVEADDGADTSNTKVEKHDRVTITAQGYTEK